MESTGVWPTGQEVRKGLRTGGFAATLARYAAFGTNPITVLYRVWRSPSKSPKKKVRSFLMGPPTLPPNWFKWNGGTFASKGERASKTLLRKNSKALP